MASKEHVMSLNVGTFDRIARIVVGAALLAFALGYLAPGTSWNWVGWIGVVPILTAIFGICPAYRLFGLSTR
jgi:sulfite exporter TauE/SafE